MGYPHLSSDRIKRSSLESIETLLVSIPKVANQFQFNLICRPGQTETFS